MATAHDWDRLAGVPERAIDSFERVHRVNVAVHDLTGLLGAHLEESHGYHRHPICQAVKAGGNGQRCRAWEVDELRPQLEADLKGVVRVCHMGLLEWSVPVRLDGELALVLFAGPRAGDDVTLTVHGQPPQRDRLTLGTRRRSVHMPVRVRDSAEAEDVLEALHQLAARLHAWLVTARTRLGRDDGTIRLREPRRDSVIRQFVHERHTRPISPTDLATVLGLSPSRTAHVVREETGRTLAQLVHDARVQTACWLLTQTDLPLKEIVRRVGYDDLSHFHRTFRHRTGQTPARYRRSVRV